MAKQAKTVLGFCPNHVHAEDAVDKLRLSGFRNTDVSALMREEMCRGVLNWPAGNERCDGHDDWVGGGGVVLIVRCDNPYWERRAEQILRMAPTTNQTVAAASVC
jgi:hypothetical protein